MDKLDLEVKDLYGPASIAGAAVALSFATRKLTGYQLGIDSSNMTGAAKAFALITAVGGAMVWKNKKDQR